MANHIPALRGMYAQRHSTERRCIKVLWGGGGIKFTLANRYLPNVNQIQTVIRYLRILSGFTEGKFIMGIDYNCPMDPLLDTSMSKSSVSFSKLKMLKRILYDHHLIDVWRIMHPK